MEIGSVMKILRTDGRTDWATLIEVLYGFRKAGSTGETKTEDGKEGNSKRISDKQKQAKFVPIDNSYQDMSLSNRVGCK